MQTKMPIKENAGEVNELIIPTIVISCQMFIHD